MAIQGRELSTEVIGLIQGLLAEHREWGRTRLSEEFFCPRDWRNSQGRIKEDMAARALLLKLERGGHTRNDRDHRLRASVEDAYLYPPIQGFCRALCAC